MLANPPGGHHDYAIRWNKWLGHQLDDFLSNLNHGKHAWTSPFASIHFLKLQAVLCYVKHSLRSHGKPIRSSSQRIYISGGTQVKWMKNENEWSARCKAFKDIWSNGVNFCLPWCLGTKLFVKLRGFQGWKPWKGNGNAGFQPSTVGLYKESPSPIKKKW